MLGANIHCYAEFGTTNHFVSPTAQLNSDILPATPKNIPLPLLAKELLAGVRAQKVQDNV
ncbi:hypothetical protein J622_02895 [Acinetobacter sp. 1564232]|nr:hypothetical protein J622_02895 [Acinetobacter sp. 1564232]